MAYYHNPFGLNYFSVGGILNVQQYEKHVQYTISAQREVGNLKASNLMLCQKFIIHKTSFGVIKLKSNPVP